MMSFVKNLSLVVSFSGLIPLQLRMDFGALFPCQLEPLTFDVVSVAR